jgi:hypothetical protein
MVTVTASDGAIGTPITVTISVTNVNEAPVFTEDEVATREVAENTEAGMPIGLPVAATDPDDPDGSIGDADPDAADAQSLAYSLGGPASGQLQTKEALDFETQSSYTVTITASDGKTDHDDTITVTINVIRKRSPRVPCGNRDPLSGREHRGRRRHRFASCSDGS